MHRLFIGLPISLQEPIIQLLNKSKLALNNNLVNWINPNQMHITLTFLGNIEENKICIIREILNTVAKNSELFEIEFNKLGVFKNINHPEVLWLGIKENSKLFAIKTLLDEKLNQKNFCIENRNYMPHLTLGRIKKINDLDLQNNLLSNNSLSELKIKETIKEIVLFESTLTSKGATYKRIHTAMIYN